MPVQLLCGNDEYSISSDLRKIRKSVLDNEFSELNRKVIYEKLPKQIELRDINELVETTPMIFGNLLIEIHSQSLFTRGKSDDEKRLNRLIDNLKTLNQNLYVVFVCVFPKDEDKKIKVNQIINKVIVTNTIMNNLDAKKNLAKIIIDSIP